MEKTLTIEYETDLGLIFVSSTDGLSTTDISTVEVPEDLDTAEEASLLFDIYCEDESLSDWVVELQPLEDLEIEVKD